MRAPRSTLARVRVALERPRLWKTSAALAALLFCALLVGAGQGSITVVIHRAAAFPAGGAPWERWCTRGSVRQDRVRLAFCARVDGFVLSRSNGPGKGEVHVAVLGGFHLTIVKLPIGMAGPSLGSRLVAIGPLMRARDGQREVQAFQVQR
jgi:hypothetical protein